VDFFDALKSLKTLILAQNALSSLEDIDQLVHLEYLNLGFNNLSSQEALGPLISLKNLKSLIIWHNLVKKREIITVVSSMESLKYIDY
jgi:Leucine-rich repeat (LRR) protein